MLFNSYAFLFVFLPVTLLGYQIAGRFHRKAVVAWLGLMSLVFYAYWHPAFLLVLVCSIAVNYTIAALMSRQIPNHVASRTWLLVAILLNLGALGYFKYLFPGLNYLSVLATSARHFSDIALPLGISFFTFTQIAFLVDLHQGIAKQQDLPSYVLFVTFFPHLIAGPILHHKDMMPQFQADRPYRLRADDLTVGLSWFILGLAKKVLLADHFVSTADTGFSLNGPISATLAWRTVLSYALQLYFDFSGYSDMALGLARMFSINFPLNFNSPYKASSIIDFWQRWHITLSQYITAYVYSPLQLWIRARREKQGKPVARKMLGRPDVFASMIAAPMFFTMFVAGLWHGAGFQFIVYGLLHGTYLTVNHAWRLMTHKRTATVTTVTSNGVRESFQHAGYVLLTFLCVLIAQIFFRARSSSHALSLVAGLVGAHGISAYSLFPGERPSKALLDCAGMVIGFIIVWSLPNTQQILSRYRPSLQESAWNDPTVPTRLLWSPRTRWAVVLGTIFFIALVHLQNPSTFLYFQF